MAVAVSKRFMFEGNTFTTVIASLLMFNVHVQPRMHGFQEPFNEYL